MNTTNGTAPLPVQFIDQSTGDGATSTEQNPIDTCTTAGTFMGNLIVTGPGGLASRRIPFVEDLTVATGSGHLSTQMDRFDMHGSAVSPVGWRGT